VKAEISTEFGMFFLAATGLLLEEVRRHLAAAHRHLLASLPARLLTFLSASGKTLS